jgi:hypothetical protein
MEGYMSGFEKFHNLASLFTSSFSVNTQEIEELRDILGREQQRTVTYEEAEEVGKGLISLYETLANGRKIVATKENDDL